MDRHPQKAGRLAKQVRNLASIFWALSLGLGLVGCNYPIATPAAEPPTAAPTATPTATTAPPTPTPTPLAAGDTHAAPEGPPASTPSPTAPVEVPIETYSGPPDRVTLLILPGGRYIVIGDSLTYGSTMSGNNNYEDICENRWPFVEQLAAETGIASTASLDRGDSMKTPFFSQVSRGRLETFCTPPPETPTLSTAVPGSTTAEWLSDLRYFPPLTESLASPENGVVLLQLAADVYAHKIDKPFVTADEYAQNIGELVSWLAAQGKVVYLGLIPHVREGTFIPAGELEGINARIDAYNQRLKKIAADNGYQDAERGEWVDFGAQIVEQDGLRIWVNTVQLGPELDVLSDTALREFYAKDGLHFHAEGYNLIGQAWAEALRAPVRALKYLVLEAE